MYTMTCDVMSTESDGRKVYITYIPHFKRNVNVYSGKLFYLAVSGVGGSLKGWVLAKEKSGNPRSENPLFSIPDEID